MFYTIIRNGVFGTLLLVINYQGLCQVASAGARCAALGGISAVLEDGWSTINNPAGLARYKHYMLATSLEQRFLMKETGQYALTGSIPVPKGCFGLSALFSGYGQYIDQGFITGFGKTFGEKILAGISLVYHYHKAGDYANALHQVSYNIGAIFLPSDRISFAFAAFNPFQLYFKNQEYATLPSIFKLGFSYAYNNELVIHSELNKDLNYPVTYKVGFEYSFQDIFVARAGLSGFPISLAFGAGIRKKSILLDIASGYHIYLGFTPLLSFQYTLK